MILAYREEVRQRLRQARVALRQAESRARTEAVLLGIGDVTLVQARRQVVESERAMVRIDSALAETRDMLCAMEQQLAEAYRTCSTHHEMERVRSAAMVIWGIEAPPPPCPSAVVGSGVIVGGSGTGWRSRRLRSL